MLRTEPGSFGRAAELLVAEPSRQPQRVFDLAFELELNQSEGLSFSPISARATLSLFIQ